jgi:hypothetical protein
MRFSIYRRKPPQTGVGLETGWQFFAYPNTLETVGFVFRIGGDGIRLPVAFLAPNVIQGQEAGIHVHQRFEVKASVLARFLNLIDLSADTSVGHKRTLNFEIKEPIRTLTTDAAIEAELEPFLEGFRPDEDSSYYVIRQTRSATSMTFRFGSDLMAELGGEAKVSANLCAGAKLNLGSETAYEIDAKFPERLLVTFQPERIVRISAGLAKAGSYGLAPVTKTLEWREPAET